MKKQVILIILLVIIGISGKTQKVDFGLGFLVGIPQNEFSEVTDAIGFGGDINLVYYPAHDFPLGIGAQFGGMIYGRNTQHETLIAELKVGNTVLDTFHIPLDIITTNSIVNFELIMRLRAPLDLVQPYAEGIAGINYISTSTKIIDRTEDHKYSSPESNVIKRKTQLADAVFVYGFGGGLMFKLGKTAWIDLRADYLKGGEAQYYDGDDTRQWKVEFTGSSQYDPNNVSGDDLEFTARPKKSRTDILMVNLGFIFRF